MFINVLIDVRSWGESYRREGEDWYETQQHEDYKLLYTDDKISLSFIQIPLLVRRSSIKQMT